jgi:Cof subfamily protein (haloacid dehalogenase superfamily)
MSTRDALVFVDLDGTLLDSRRSMSAATDAALRRAARHGIEVIPVSSRPFAGLEVRRSGGWGAAVALNGAVSRAAAGAAPREAIPIDKQAIRLVVAAGREMGAVVNLYTAAVWACDRPAHPRVAEEIRRLRGVRPNQDTFEGLELDAVHKVLLLAVPEALVDCERRLAATSCGEVISWFRSEPEYLEIGRAGVTKRSGIERLMEIRGRVPTYAIGDNVSDIPMFEVVDIGIAVANASPAVREAADVVVASNDDDGAAQALARIVGGNL